MSKHSNLKEKTWRPPALPRELRRLVKSESAKQEMSIVALLTALIEDGIKQVNGK